MCPGSEDVLCQSLSADLDHLPVESSITSSEHYLGLRLRSCASRILKK